MEKQVHRMLRAAILIIEVAKGVLLMRMVTHLIQDNFLGPQQKLHCVGAASIPPLRFSFKLAIKK